ncbi:hypothetical protein ACET3X_009129 [Alternaria dauci]|uniref:Uncharacterized protein n=1 Tax=Alternaria dauci TaxID=48095 RepID=A0ABR3U7X7_9PLEO
MPHATAVLAQDTHGFDNSKKAELELLLKTKLQGVPTHHLPTLILADILNQTPRALNIANIPPDIQLHFFLQNRAAIDTHAGKPIKDEDKQNLDITRAIWFYRLDEAHQFQRFHDLMRWNTTIYVALLAQYSRQSGQKYSSPSEVRASHHGHHGRDSYKPIPPAAIRFITQYLTAVLEHHNTPTSSFAARESFIRVWKSSPWDLFTVFGGAQKKLMKNAMKVLSKNWEAELAIAEKQMGKERYEMEVGKFVGGLIPGRKDQGVRAWEKKSKEKGVRGDIDMEIVAPKRQGEGKETDGNELLEALSSPYTSQTKDSKKQAEARGGVTTVEGTPVVDTRYAIAVVQSMKPRDILPVLIRLFPE